MENELQKKFIEEITTGLSQIPLSGHRKSMRLLSASYEDFVSDYTENYEYIDTGIDLFAIILSTEKLVMIKGIQNLLKTIFMDIYFTFDNLSRNQKERLLNVITAYYKINNYNGIELLLFDVVAREYPLEEVLHFFEAVLSNPFKENYISSISLGLDNLYRRAKDDKKETIVIDKFVRLMHINKNL